MNKWVKFMALPARDRVRLIVYAFLLLPVQTALRWFGYQKVYAFVESQSAKRAPFSGQAEEAIAEAKHCVTLVSVAARNGLVLATCLQQSLLVFWLLRRQGILTDLRIGVRRQGESIIAHAWVEFSGIVISEGSQGEQSYTAFEGLPSAH